MIPADFKFLCSTWHYADRYNIFWINSGFFSIIRFCNSAEHLLRRLAGRHIFCHIWEIMLAIFYPSWRTGGNHRQNAAVLYSFNKFVSFFHNCKVRRKISVKYFVKADSSKGRNHLAFYVGADWITEFLSKTSSHRRSSLYNHMFRRICNSSQHVVCTIFFLKSSSWTYCNTLTAGYTAGFSQSHLKWGADKCGKTTHVCSDYADALYLVADCAAAAAENTFAVVANHVSCAVINSRRGFLTVKEAFCLNAQFLTKLLKLAVSAAHAGKTFSVVVGKKQLQCFSSGFNYLWSVGPDFHIRVNWIYTGSHQTSCALHLYHTHAAGGDFVDFF